MTNDVGINSTIALATTIQPGDVYVVCNSNADLSLQNFADKLSPLLDFENNVSLELKHTGITIDRIGESGPSTSGSFNLTQFLNDPIGYTASSHLDLNDFKNIDIRRGMFVNKGDPIFNNLASMIGNWSYYSNYDRSNIGLHNSVCNNASGDPIIGFRYNYSGNDPYYMTELSSGSILETHDQLVVKSDQSTTTSIGFNITQAITFGNILTGSYEMYIFNSTNNVYGTGAINNNTQLTIPDLDDNGNFIYTNFTGAQAYTSGNIFTGQKTVLYPYLSHKDLT